MAAAPAATQTAPRGQPFPRGPPRASGGFAPRPAMPFAPGFARGPRPQQLGFAAGVPGTQAPAAPRPALPPVTMPHLDASLTFDFEPAIEDDAVRREAKRVVAVRATDPRFKTVVCMHWVNGLCMKADACEFLHEIDVDRMPDCRQGQRCNDKMCAFKHVKDEERPLCNNYRYGFCPHGGTCRYQHRKRPAEELPQISEIAFVGSALVGGNADDDDEGQGGVKTLPPQQQRNPNWRTAMCHSFIHNQTCSFGDSCNYAHSEEEMLRNIAIRNSQFSNNSSHAGAGAASSSSSTTGANQSQSSNGGGPSGSLPPSRPAQIVSASPEQQVAVAPRGPAQPVIVRRSIPPLDRYVIDLRDWSEQPPWPQVYMTPLMLQTPPGMVLPDDRLQCRYFVMRADSFGPLFPSIKRNQWAVEPSVAVKVNEAFLTKPTKVFFFFAVDAEYIFSGSAMMKTPFGETSQGFVCGIQWVAACDLPFKKTAYLTSVDPEVSRELPVAMAVEGAELPPSVGRVLMLMLLLEQQIMPPVDDVSEDEPLVVHPLGPAPDVLRAIENTPISPPEVGPTSGGVNVAPHAVPVRGPGYLFKIPTKELMDEVMARGLVGAPQADFNALNQVAEPGCMFLMYSVYDAKLHGVFEAISGVEKSWDPSAFEGMEWIPQVKFRVLQPCEAMPESAFPSYKGQSGIIPAPEMQVLCNNLAYRARRGPTLAPLKSAIVAAVARGVPIVDQDPNPVPVAAPQPTAQPMPAAPAPQPTAALPPRGPMPAPAASMPRGPPGPRGPPVSARGPPAHGSRPPLPVATEPAARSADSREARSLARRKDHDDDEEEEDEDGGGGGGGGRPSRRDRDDDRSDSRDKRRRRSTSPRHDRHHSRGQASRSPPSRRR